MVSPYILPIHRDIPKSSGFANTIITVRQLSCNFGAQWVIKNLSFDVTTGEFLFITGPSNAGKTTLLRLLHGDLPLIRGTASIAGYKLNGLPNHRLPQLRRDVSFVFQNLQLLPNHTVASNISLALEVRGMPRVQTERRVRAALRSLHLEAKASSLCRHLSANEQQRVAVARAVVAQPKVLLADEPTSNLDPKLSLQLVNLFSYFQAHGMTILLTTKNHELSTIQPDARVLRLSEGSLVPA